MSWSESSKAEDYIRVASSRQSSAETKEERSAGRRRRSISTLIFSTESEG